MNPTTLFLTGIGVGTGLLILGLLLGIWVGSKRSLDSTGDQVSREQFLLFLKNLSTWTSDIAGDVSKYQSQLNSLSRGVGSDIRSASPEQVQRLLDNIMDANRQLQNRLDATEERLELQTKEIANYITEARTDSLTGLSNRRAFDQQLDAQFKEFKQGQTVFSLALIDVDYFKKVNDTYGHPAGDAVLSEMARRLQHHLTDAVQIARYGGEEFAILLLKPLMEAAAIMDDVRRAVAKDPIEAEGHRISFTMSCGLTQAQADDRIGKLVRRADEALYSAKLGGRNRVYVHDGKLCHLFGVPENASQRVQPNRVDVIEAGHGNPPTESIRKRLQERLDRIVHEEAKRL